MEAKAESVTFALVRRFRRNRLESGQRIRGCRPRGYLGGSADLETGGVAFHSSDAADKELQPRLRLITPQTARRGSRE